MVKEKPYRCEKLSCGDRIFYFINCILLSIIFLVICYPLVYVLSSSFSSAKDVVMGNVTFLPVNFSLEGYKKVLAYAQVYTGYYNTLIYTVLGTLLAVIVTLLCAYPLSRRELPGKKGITFLFLFTMYFNGGMIPTYLLIKNLGLYNTRSVMIIPMAMSVFNMIIARTYFLENIPEELYEYSKLDGCDDFTFFFRIVCPLSKTIIAVLVLFYAIKQWNSFFQAFLYLSDSRKFPLQLILRDILVKSQHLAIVDSGMLSPEEITRNANMAELVKYCIIVVASLPIICFYPFIQKYFVKGVTLGSVKG